MADQQLVAVSGVRSAAVGGGAEANLQETHTFAVSYIIPPPDIRAIADKTASFVAKNGVEFEKRILANEANNAKFNFLKPGDPYNEYYKRKIDSLTAAAEKGGEGTAPGEGDATAPQQQAIPPPPQTTTTTAPPPSLAPPTAKPPVPIPKSLEEPEAEHYTSHIPEGLTLMDVDVIKLTAQFVARNGKTFLTGLAAREHANPTFNFLKPTHSLFAFFTSLCDAYSRVLMPPKGTIEKLRKDVEDRTAVLERALNRLAWEKQRDADAAHAATAEEAERLAQQSIDWHDFVVVETIEFDEGEDIALPPPMTLKQIQQMARAASLVEQQEQAAQEAAAPAMDVEEVRLVNAGATAGGTAAAGTMDEDDDVDMELSDEEETIKVVKNYKRPEPRAAADQAAATKFVVSPITGELIPIEHMAEHMRISLIDPRWKDQREIMLGKIKETTKASDDEIGRNLTFLARTRPDVFGSAQEEVSALVGQQIEQAREAGVQQQLPDAKRQRQE